MIVFQKLGENTAILAVREFQRGKITAQLGNDWTEMRLGMFFTGVDAWDNTLAGAEETLGVSGVDDYVTFGLKDSNSYFLPGEAGSTFLGIRSTGTTSKARAPVLAAGWFADSNEECSAVGYAGATLINGGVIANGSLRYADPEPESGYNGFYCVRFVVSGRGLSSQAVSISVARSDQVEGTDYGKSALYQLMHNSTFGAAKTVAWNNGGSARALPDAAWVRIPFYNTRLRIQEIMSVKNEP